MNYVPVISIYCHKAKQSYYIKEFLSINSYDVLFSFLFRTENLSDQYTMGKYFFEIKVGGMPVFAKFQTNIT